MHVQDPADVQRDASDALPGARRCQRASAMLPWWLGLVAIDVRRDPAADQREVADDVSRLVAYELVGPAERRRRPARRRRAPRRGLEVAPWSEPPGPERLHLAE